MNAPHSIARGTDQNGEKTSTLTSTRTQQRASVELHPID